MFTQKLFRAGLLACGLLLLSTHIQAADDAQAQQHSFCSTSDKQDPSTTGDYERPVSLRLLVPNILCDQKAIWLFPLKVGQDHNWVATLAIAGTAAALMTADPSEGRYFRQSTSFQGFNKVFSSSNSAIGTILVPSSLFVAGLIRKDNKMQHTALLAAEAAADAEILTVVLKGATKRARPNTFPVNGGNYWDSWFESKGSPLSSSGGFPSGHTIAAFSIATVIAHQYRNHRWVPYVSYGAAALIGFSRLSLSEHFASDVFMGAALGFSISRFAVLRF